MLARDGRRARAIPGTTVSDCLLQLQNSQAQNRGIFDLTIAESRRVRHFSNCCQRLFTPPGGERPKREGAGGKPRPRGECLEEREGRKAATMRGGALGWEGREGIGGRREARRREVADHG